jgi:hypothetical protein
MRELLLLAVSDRQKILPLLIVCGALPFVALALPKSWLRTAVVYASGAVIGTYTGYRLAIRLFRPFAPAADFLTGLLVCGIGMGVGPVVVLLALRAKVNERLLVAAMLAVPAALVALQWLTGSAPS